MTPLTVESLCSTAGIVSVRYFELVTWMLFSNCAAKLMRLSNKKELKLDIQKIVVDLKSEKDRLDRAIAALEDTDSGSVASKSRIVAKPRISVDTRSACASK